MRWTVQIALLGALLVFCLLQVPKKALFFSPCAETPSAPSGAAFVELDEAVYRQLLRQAHELGWARQARVWTDEKGAAADVRVLDDPTPPPEPLPLPRAFRRVAPFAAARPCPVSRASLQPESLAAPALTTLPAPAAPPPAAADDILDLDSYESLQERK